MTHASVQGLPRKMYYEKYKPNPVRYASKCPGKKNWQKHHILPCTSVQESIAASSVPNLDDALKYFTSWNINDRPNLMPMPTRTAYQNAYGKKGGRSGGVMPALVDTKPLIPVRHSNLPCHQPTNWGHTAYNKEVEADLAKTVWSKVLPKLKKHKLNASDVSAALNSLAKTWKGNLEKQGDPSLANWRLMLAGAPLAHNNFTMVDLGSSPI